jgi:hypothetical protein
LDPAAIAAGVGSEVGVGEFWIFGANGASATWGSRLMVVVRVGEEERGKFGEVIIDEITTGLLGSGGAVCLVGAYVYSVTFYSFFILSSSRFIPLGVLQKTISARGFVSLSTSAKLEFQHTLKQDLGNKEQNRS